MRNALGQFIEQCIQILRAFPAATLALFQTKEVLTVQSTRIPWKKNFCSGFHTIDDQHRELIGLINTLMDRLAANCPVASIRYYLAEIHELIEVHFRDEERIMLAAGYNGAAAHKTDHDRLLLRIRANLEEVRLDRSEVSKIELTRTLDDWFSVHFRTYDRDFHQMSGLDSHRVDAEEAIDLGKD